MGRALTQYLACVSLHRVTTMYRPFVHVMACMLYLLDGVFTWAASRFGCTRERCVIIASMIWVSLFIA